MDRSKFLKTAGALLPLSLCSKNALLGAMNTHQKLSPDDDQSFNTGDLALRSASKIPPYLQKGDCIGITSPSGHIQYKELLPAISRIKSWGLTFKTGQTIGLKDGTFGGTDQQRATDFQLMLEDPAIKAILCARGGYGAVRIIDRIDFSSLNKNPKWIIGFSDATVFHMHIAHNYHMATLHSKMCNSFPDNWDKATEQQKATIDSIRDALMNTQKMHYRSLMNPMNRSGSAEAELIGGNMRTIENLSGTRSSLEAAGKILFLEETHEYLYNMDRMLWNLERTGQLKHLKGLIIGAMIRTPQRDPNDEMNKSIYELVMEKVKEYNYPVTFDFPVGHIVENYALKCGVPHRLDVTTIGTTLTEL